jgi:hypothetical protein
VRACRQETFPRYRRLKEVTRHAADATTATAGEQQMQLRFLIILGSLLTAAAILSGCAGTGGGGGYQSFMQKCTANAKTEAEHSQCAWENASRMADGGK